MHRTTTSLDIFLTRRGSAADLPRVCWHLVHGAENDFRTETVWPPADSRALTLHLTAEGEAPDGNTPGRLSPTPPEGTGTASWIHDPQDPVPSAAPNAFAYLQTNPRLHDWSKRDDVLVFDAEPTTEPLDLAGPVSLRVTLTTTGPSTDLFAKLLDVHPDGQTHRPWPRARRHTRPTPDAAPRTCRIPAAPRPSAAPAPAPAQQ